MELKRWSYRIVLGLIFLITINSIKAQTLPFTGDVEVLDSILAGDDTRTNSLGEYVLQEAATILTWASDSIDFHPHISVYDHTTNSWSEKIRVGTNPYFDRHNYPKILQNGEGRLFIFFGAHADNLQLAIQDTIGVWDSWTQVEMDTPEASYPMPFRSKTTGRMYVFYHYTDNWQQPVGYRPHRTFVYVYSDDDGVNWSDTVMCVDRAIAEDADVYISIEVFEHLIEDKKVLSLVPKGKKTVLTVPNYLGGSHVRKFDSEEEVIERYGDMIDVLDISTIKYGTGKIFVLYGKKK